MKHFILAFALAALLYVVLFVIIERRRESKGPWIVTFTNTPAAAPTLIINQRQLAVTNVWIQFTNAQLPSGFAPATVRFDQPRAVPFDLPFGRCIFSDLTFLPGSATFSLFGRQVELLPRALIIDHREYGWATNHVVQIGVTNGTTSPSR